MINTTAKLSLYSESEAKFFIFFYYNHVDKSWQAAVTGEGIFISTIKSSKLQ